ncbi:AlpA family phage regulatory protein [Pseudoalteromonas luteoviolacea]|uniref:helix-turn-helix transcriptional regulator n=1 Tax=Pseudoalteromonas luteoviolacea TaxID=43657 RepID=UPI001F28074C|nr:AlpA family phage regulatory protein [Pseudoalteromonas luteoviolacea]MCF6442329.1 AlpA family phage regulatory protein [Pseudoalteromonas luteoviolacea]
MNAESLYIKNLRGEIVTGNDRFIRIKDAAALCSFGRTTLLALEEQFKFPPKYTISKGRVAYILSDVEEFMRLGAENFKVVYGEQLACRKEAMQAAEKEFFKVNKAELESNKSAKAKALALFTDIYQQVLNGTAEAA